MNMTILGAGAWGTALAIHFALHNHHIRLWTHEKEHAKALQNDRENARFFPHFSLPENIVVCSDFADSLRDSELILIVTPVAGLRNCARFIKMHQVMRFFIFNSAKKQLN
jgi:glycerol-3-phosphate dehydrogenase (NAD(P)+)